MQEQENTIKALIIDLQGPIVQQSSPLQWTANVFASLLAISNERKYHLYLLASDQEQQALAVAQVLAEQGIPIEKVITSISEIEHLDETLSVHVSLSETSALRSIAFTSWAEVLPRLVASSAIKERSATISRHTKETSIELSLNLDGTGKAEISTGLPFFDHMLDQIARHGRIDLQLTCKGDLEVDEHHTVEDVAIVLGQAIKEALGDKRGISRYGSALVPMDEALAQVAIDFSNRPWFVWQLTFTRDVVGTFPTELLTHFFKSFSDEARCTLHMKVNTANVHHQAEALCKGFANAVKTAVMRYPYQDELPSTKGML